MKEAIEKSPLGNLRIQLTQAEVEALIAEPAKHLTNKQLKAVALDWISMQVAIREGGKTHEAVTSHREWLAKQIAQLDTRQINEACHTLAGAGVAAIDNRIEARNRHLEHFLSILCGPS